MKTTVVATRVVFSLVGIALIVLGVLFWIGEARSLLSVHMVLGFVFVLCMWLLAGTALYARRARIFALFAFAWSLVVPALGIAQLRLIPGPEHWIIQAVHLLVGLVAMGIGHALAKRVLDRSAAASQNPAPA